MSKTRQNDNETYSLADLVAFVDESRGVHCGPTNALLQRSSVTTTILPRRRPNFEKKRREMKQNKYRRQASQAARTFRRMWVFAEGVQRGGRAALRRRGRRVVEDGLVDLAGGGTALANAIDGAGRCRVEDLLLLAIGVLVRPLRSVRLPQRACSIKHRTTYIVNTETFSIW